MKIYKLSASRNEYFDIGHKTVKSLISIWQMYSDGTIAEKIITMPSHENRHTIIFPNMYKVIAEGRCDIGKKQCSCAYYRDGRGQSDWIKSLLKEKFGQDIQITEF